MAVRYTQEQKDKVVAFVSDYNKKNNRGGQSAAASEFGISPITIAKWLKSAGVKKSTKAKKAPAKKAGRGRPRKKAAATTRDSLSGVLGRMQEIQKEIESLQSEFDSLKAKL